MIELSIIGILVGFVSGFFGVGGGMILVPALMYLGFNIKEAISISVMQMVFSSIYGSFLNFKKALDKVKEGFIIGLGGFLGGLQSGYIIKNVSDEFLAYLLIAILIFSIARIYKAPSVFEKEEQKKKNSFVLFIIGSIIGLIAMSIGIGGAILLTPILVSFLKYDLKDASAMGLFFIIFSSLAGFISLSYHGQMLYSEGLIVGLASLLGVYLGIRVKNKTNSNSFKKFILFMNISILISLLIKVFYLETPI